ncbi:hypothetical protein LTR37_009085 [Vermiconidia calcicola]|uniref:Uncharacterized protein n=1 Tax=Vermiconidia calcicola TaxID=1690605 RepID=A0ACC3N9E2_9PEZI|nr:hypothetical protein LTR37_009085 [Vermiconidia calcicola]
MASQASKDDLRPAKKRRLDYTQDIAVLVGEEKERIVVHKNILCSSSPFFKAACDGGWKESRERTVSLPDVTRDTFLIYTQWLYTGTLELDDELDVKNISSLPEGSRKKTATRGFDAIGRCYVLGDFIGDKCFCNILTDRLITFNKTINVSPYGNMVKMYWDRLREGSGLRRSLVDLCACHLKDTAFADRSTEMPHSFLAEMTRVLLAGRKKDLIAPTKNEDKCSYHEHHEHHDDSDRCVRSEATAAGERAATTAKP